MSLAEEENLGSKIGSVLVIVYAVCSMVFAATSFFCSTTTCQTMLLVPILPWPILFSPLAQVPLIVYPLFLLMNAFMVYLIGAGIGILIERYTGNRLTPHE